MKKTQRSFLVLLLVSWTAVAGPPIAQITFRVKDDLGNIVSGAPVTASTFWRWIPGEGFGSDKYKEVKGVTDTNGVVVLKLRSKTGEICYSVSGAYDRGHKMEFGGKVYYVDRGNSIRFTNHVAGKWQPWNTVVDIEIKPVICPIPMFARSYATRIPRLQVPEYGKAIGFDLMRGDWVAPYGKGETSDFVFTLECKIQEGKTRDGYQIYDASLQLSFSNNGDGIQPIYVNPRTGSALKLPRFAPETGYIGSWRKTISSHEHGHYQEDREDENYFFRVRTERDKHGVITNALYGKIQGRLSFDYKRNISFTYYLNPTPNDRNLEFDPSRNLFTDLNIFEQVEDP